MNTSTLVCTDAWSFHTYRMLLAKSRSFSWLANNHILHSLQHTFSQPLTKLLLKSFNHSVRYKVSHYTHKPINKPITQFSTGTTIAIDPTTVQTNWLINLRLKQLFNWLHMFDKHTSSLHHSLSHTHQNSFRHSLTHHFTQAYFQPIASSAALNRPFNHYLIHSFTQIPTPEQFRVITYPY